MTALSQGLSGPVRSALRWGLAVAIVLALCSFSVAFANPNEFKWEFLAVGNLLILTEIGLLGGNRGWTPDKTDALLLAFLAYAGISVAWSADGASGGLAVVKWLLLAVPFLYFRHQGGEPLLQLALRPVAVANAVVLFFAITGWAHWGGFGNENFLAEFQLISLPFLVALIGRESQAAVKLLVSLLVALELVDLVAFNPSRIEWLVLLGAIAFLAEALIWRRLRLRMVLIVNMAAAAAAIGAMVWCWQHTAWPRELFLESVRPRLALILNTLRLWWDAPILGHGAGSFDALYPLYKEWHLRYFEHADKLLANKMVKAGAAHNEILQFLAEYGVMGLGILGALAWQVVRQGLGRGDAFRAAGAGALLVGLVIGLIEFPLQNPATALLLALAAAMLARVEDAAVAAGAAAPRRLRFAGAAALCISALLAVGVFRFDRSNRLFGQVAGLLGTDPQAAFETNREAFRLNPWDRRIRMQLYTTLTFWTENSPAPVSSPEENDRIFALSTRGAENQPVLLLGRVQHLLNSGRYQERQAETEALLDKLKRESSRMADVWILEAYHALLQDDSERAAAAIRRAQSLDPTPEQRENLQRLRQSL